MLVSPHWLWWWCCRCLPLLVVSVLFAQWPLLLDRVVPLLLAYALMPPATDDNRTAAAASVFGAIGGSRVRETKKALLGRSSGGGAGYGRSRSSTSLHQSSSSVTAPPFVAKGTVSKISEKFQAQPPPAPRTTRIPKLLNPARSALPLPPLPPLPPPVIKYEIKRRQEKLLSELHRRRSGGDDRTTSSICRLPGVSGCGDSSVSSDCGSSSDSEKSVYCGGSIDIPATVAAAVSDDDKPGSPHSSGYESVEEPVTCCPNATSIDFVGATDLATVPAPAVSYSWVFGTSVNDESVDGFRTVQPSTSSSSSSDGCCGFEDGLISPAEDRLERLVTFASVASYPALTRAKLDQDDGDAPAAVRRHFGGNDVATPVAAMAGYLSPIPECSSTEPNSVETVEDCYSDNNNKVYILTPISLNRGVDILITANAVPSN